MKPFRPVLYVLGALLVAALWLQWCHDPSVRHDAIAGHEDAATDARVDTLRKMLDSTVFSWMRERDSTGREIRRLKARIPRAQPDTSGRNGQGGYPTAEQLPSGCAGAPASCDSLIVVLEEGRRADSLTILFLRAAHATRDTLEDRLRASRDNWRRAAQPGPFKQIARALPWIAGGYLLAKVAK